MHRQDDGRLTRRPARNARMHKRDLAAITPGARIMPRAPIAEEKAEIEHMHEIGRRRGRQEQSYRDNAALRLSDTGVKTSLD